MAGTTLLNLLLALLILFTPHGSLTGSPTPESLALVQLTVLSYITTSLVVAVVNDDRNRLAQQLKLEARSLEERVSDRTKELKQAQAELTQLNSQLEERVEQRTADLVTLSQRLTMALKAGKMGCWDYDLRQQLAVWDDRMFEMYGYEPVGDQQVSPDYWFRALHPEDLQKLLASLEEAEEDSTRQQYEIELRSLRPDGQVCYMFNYGLILRDEQEKIAKIIGLTQDITQQRLAEQSLQQSNEELLRANRIKDEFLAIMSHELRTPLNAVLGMSESLQEEIFGPLNPQQQQALQTIEKSGEHLLNLINDILDLSKIEANQLQLNLSPTVIADLCQASILLVLPQANKKQIQLTHRIPRNLPELLIDPRRWRQALINLLNNAVKFTPAGGQVCLEVLCPLPTPTPAETRPVIRFSVQDTGIGIAPDNLTKLFQPFVQIDSALNRKYEGTGLGLALVKRIAELHGGEVGVSSELGVGSCFWIDLPCPEGTVFPEMLEDDAMSAIPVEASGVKQAPLILLAEDNLASVITIQSYLEAKGYRLMVAEDGEAALRMTYEYHPQLIVMDIQMPKLNGIQAIEQLRQDPQFRQLPIIALTALAMEGDEQRCLAAGASAYLSKPVKLKQLLTLMASLNPELGVQGPATNAIG
jgi:signal transduction histidine kinase/ActR/RegA family two-component response regulator